MIVVSRFSGRIRAFRLPALLCSILRLLDTKAWAHALSLLMRLSSSSSKVLHVVLPLDAWYGASMATGFLRCTSSSAWCRNFWRSGSGMRLRLLKGPCPSSSGAIWTLR